MTEIQEIPIHLIDDFPGHPFQIRMDEDMDQLVESIRQNGVITPVTLRPKPGGRYELVSGHRRKKACELAGLKTIKAEVKNLSREEAIIFMVDSNLQRTRILPSEKAFSYKMRLEAMNHQGRRYDITLSPMGTKLRSDEELAQKTGDSRNQIQRYIRLTYLLPELLDMVDEGRIAFRPAVEISYLTKDEQKDLLETIRYEDATPSLAQAIKMKEFSQAGKLNADVILSIMCEKKPNQKEKYVLKAEKLKPYLPQNITPQQTEDYILKALEYYHRYRQRQKEQGR
ncbi:MAG: ParB/RepB/Spo0J family partition protein [Candidatus Faecousia sp.]|nr:ParB/RepB/Spo0J family partition protein [Candidatus Faecousia sp.]